MQKNEHKRVKHGHHPGDVSKKVKIAMREGKTPVVVRPGHTISEESANVYCRMLRKKGRKVQRRRDKHRIEEDTQ